VRVQPPFWGRNTARFGCRCALARTVIADMPRKRNAAASTVNRSAFVAPVAGRLVGMAVWCCVPGLAWVGAVVAGDVDGGAVVGATVVGGAVVGATVVLVVLVVGAATTVIVTTAVLHDDSPGPQSW
jgi:hypothetical protein